MSAIKLYETRTLAMYITKFFTGTPYNLNLILTFVIAGKFTNHQGQDSNILFCDMIVRERIKYIPSQNNYPSVGTGYIHQSKGQQN